MTLAMYAGVAVACARLVSLRVRCVALALVLAAPPALVYFDHASQYRWRKADLAGAPSVLPVIPPFQVAAVRSDLWTLDVDMTGPGALFVSISRCRDCAPRREMHDDGLLVVVDGEYEIYVTQAGVGDDVVATLAGVSVRPASLDELAHLPIAPERGSH
jgi:hypothetical protein